MLYVCCILYITSYCIIISHSWCSSGRVWAPTGRLYGPHSAGDGAMRVRARLLWRSGPGQSWTPCDQWPVSSPRSLTSVAAPASDCTSVHSVHVYTGQALPSCRPQLTKSKWHRPQQIKKWCTAELSRVHRPTYICHQLERCQDTHKALSVSDSVIKTLMAAPDQTL